MLENLCEYLEVKNREIEIVSRLIQSDFPERAKTIADVVRSKIAMRKQFLRSVVEKTAPETNINQKYSYKFYNGKYDWAYQRFDLTYVGEHLFHALYSFSLSDEVISLPLITSCGMSAVSACMMALNKELSETKFIFQNDVYFESFWFSEKYLSKSSAESKNYVLYIDSISKFDASIYIAKFPLHKFKAIVFDTTCYSGNSEIIRSVIQSAHTNKIPCFLVRSHTKLDFLGMEFSRMGSLVAIHSDSRGEFSGNVMDRARDFISKVGSTSIPELIPDFLDNTEYREHTNSRIERIRQSNAGIYELVAQECKGLAISFAHNCFFTLESENADIIRDL